MSHADLCIRAGIASGQLYLRALSLLVPVKETSDFIAPNTDGACLFYNADFLRGFSRNAQYALLIRALLHLSLRHPQQCGRDPMLRSAAEVVVARIFGQYISKLSLPGMIRFPALEDEPLEKITARMTQPIFCDEFYPAPTDNELLEVQKIFYEMHILQFFSIPSTSIRLNPPPPKQRTWIPSMPAPPGYPLFPSIASELSDRWEQELVGILKGEMFAPEPLELRLRWLSWLWTTQYAKENPLFLYIIKTYDMPWANLFLSSLLMEKYGSAAAFTYEPELQTFMRSVHDWMSE
jgi:hypothetical protein